MGLETVSSHDPTSAVSNAVLHDCVRENLVNIVESFGAVYPWSSVAESAAKSVVALRSKGGGSHWSENSRGALALRGTVESERMQPFSAYHAGHREQP